MNHLQYNDPTWVLGLVDATLARFNKSQDVELLRLDFDDKGCGGPVSERAIAHRLAVHLEEEFRSRKLEDSDAISVDCEYNRHREAVKALSVEKELKKRVKKNKRKLRKDKLRKGWYAFSGFPDMILHKRTVDETNILVLELKRSSNKIDVDYDDLKLQLFTRTGDYGYGYTLGAAIIASDEGEKMKRQLTRGILYHAGMEFTG